LSNAQEVRKARQRVGTEIGLGAAEIEQGLEIIQKELTLLIKRPAG
jgi:hypothetical protein